MNADEIRAVQARQNDALFGDRSETEPTVFRRPRPVDETDRIGRELVRRLLEAGVTEER